MIQVKLSSIPILENVCWLYIVQPSFTKDRKKNVIFVLRENSSANDPKCYNCSDASRSIEEMQNINTIT